MSWLYEDVHLGTGALHWEEGHDELPEERANHCQLQINDCEVAFIGGVRGPDLAASSTDIIDIWNFEERTWRYGPRYVLMYCIMNHCLFRSLDMILSYNLFYCLPPTNTRIFGLYYYLS